MFLVSKSNGQSRPVIDYRLLNSQTIDEREPIPIIRDLIDKLSGSAIFSTLDIAWAYWTLKLHPDSMEKTGFVTPFGQFEWTVLPMGLRNAAAAFMRELRHVLCDFIGKGVEIYLDDIIVHTPTLAEHYDLLSRLFRKVREEGLRIRREKCRFFAKEVEFLVHIVSEGHVRPSPSKVKAVEQFPTPQTTKQVMEFVGLANFYRSFVRDFSRIAEPLTSLTRKDSPFIWNLPQQKAFEELKLALTQPPVLAIYDPKLPLVLETDGSGLGLGSILSQRNEANELKPIAYYSYKLNEHERRYSAPELEALAVVKSVEHFVSTSRASIPTFCPIVLPSDGYSQSKTLRLVYIAGQYV